MNNNEIAALVPALQTLFESTADFMFIKNLDLSYICVSNTFAKLAGLEKREDAAGKNDFDLFDKSLAAMYREDDRKLIANGIPLIGYIEQIPAENGEARYSSVSKYLLHDDAGLPVGIIGIGKDFAATVELQNQKEKLKNADEDYKIAVEQNKIMTARYDISTDILSRSKVAVELFCLTEDAEYKPQTLIDLGIVQHDSIPTFLEFFEKMRKGEPNGSCRVQLIRGDKMPRWYQSDYSLVYYDAGIPLYSVISFEDITEQREKELAYEKLKESIYGQPLESSYIIEFNMTNNIVESVNGNLRFLNPRTVGIGFDEISINWAAANVYREDIDEFVRFMNRDTLTMLMNAGKTVNTLDFRAYIDDSFNFRWTRLTLQLVKYPDTKEIKAYLVFGDIDAEKRREQALREKSEKDLMTNAYNRNTFIHKATDIIETHPDAHHAFLMIDIDNFKSINDTLGHIVGDSVLVDTVSAISGLLGSGDIIGRMGGDEFIIMLKNYPDIDYLKRKAQLFVRVTDNEVAPGVRSSSSVGISLYPKDGHNFEELYAAADAALYRSKSLGKNCFSFYDADSDTQTERNNRTPIDIGRITKSGAVDYSRELPPTVAAAELIWFSMTMGEKFTVDYANAKFYTFIEYTPDEFANFFDMNFIKLLLPEYVKACNEKLRYVSKKNIARFDLLIGVKAKVKGVRYAYIRAKSYNDNGKITVIGTMTNMTSTIAATERVREKCETLEALVSRQCSAMAYYDIEKSTLTPYFGLKNILGNDTAIEKVPQSIVSRGLITEDTQKTYFEFYSKIRSGAADLTAKIKFCSATGKSQPVSMRGIPVNGGAVIIYNSNLRAEPETDNTHVAEAIGEQRMTMLIVDDARINRIILSEIFRNEYDIIEAEGGREALEILRERGKDISVMMLDILMPDLDGLSVLREIRGIHELSGLVTVVVSCADEREYSIKAISLGASEYVLKPVDPELVKMRVSCAVQKRMNDNLKYENLLLRTQREDALKYQNELRRLAENDTLTGLWKRDAFLTRTEEFLAETKPNEYIMSIIDIDRFKAINDTLGHSTGDSLLKYMADTIKNYIGGAGGLCCRESGDRFVTLQPNNPEQIRGISKAIDDELRKFGLPFEITTSTGRCVIDNPSLPASQIYDRAKMAHELSKNHLNSNDLYYNENMRSRILLEQEYVGSVKNALVNGEFVIYLQPQYNHYTGEIVGAEALVRWLHPVKGLIPPGDFIPVLEKSGMITSVDRYVWDAACKLLRRQIDSGMKPIPISVNMSQYDLRAPGIVETFIALIKKYDLSSELLRIEITESAYAQNPKTLMDVVRELQHNGFTVEMDDFGSGYSSLNVLKDVPVNIIKLDMRFLSDGSDMNRGGSIINSVVRMSKWIGIPVIAEGVETIEQAEYLKSIGCQYIQGYLYGRPMPEDEFISLTKEAKSSELKMTTVITDIETNLFWDPDSSLSKLFNTYIGAMAIFEVKDDKTEMIRVNSRFIREMKMNADDYDRIRLSTEAQINPSDRNKFVEMFRLAKESDNEQTETVGWAVGNIGYSPVRFTVRAMVRTSDRVIFAASVVNVGALINETQEK